MLIAGEPHEPARRGTSWLPWSALGLSMAVVAAAMLWLAIAGAVLVLAYRQTIAAAWREPVLRAPVLILESDDWGYGPLLQAERLDRIAALLSQFRDAGGHHPVATLGVVLAGPDTERMRADGWHVYARLLISDPRLEEVREAMLRGVAQKVFALQVHGMEHFWPACLLRSAEGSAEIRQWLDSAEFPSTEALPAPLQSRWTDASELPSKPLDPELVVEAATEEMQTFSKVFHQEPEVVVPPTFLWNDAVETAWALSGARVVVTPGLRNETRDAKGRVVAGEATYFNAKTGPHGVTYVVRDCYFEPSLGHTHQRAINDLRTKTQAGRPTLFEIHRLNFIGDEVATRHALEELKKLLQAACAAFPELHFMSTAELARHCRERSLLVERRTRTRVHFFLRRLSTVSRLRKLAWASGVALPAILAYALTWPVGSKRMDWLAS